ncbi:MAG: hypothetical protein AABY87_01090 [bacterium]
MTQLLEKAFEEASKLSALEQNALAQWLIDEIISERRWEKAFAGKVRRVEGKVRRVEGSKGK